MLLTTAMAQAQQSNRLDRAYRISGTFENGRVVALEATPLQVRLPLTVTERLIREASPADGYFLEMLNGDEESLLRLRIDDPSFVLMEYEDPKEPGRIVSKEIHPDKVEFSLLIPAPPGSRTLKFMKVAPDQRALSADLRLSDDIGTFILPASGAGPAVLADEGGVR
jgi:hypothetical protein